MLRRCMYHAVQCLRGRFHESATQRLRKQQLSIAQHLVSHTVTNTTASIDMVASLTFMLGERCTMLIVSMPKLMGMCGTVQDLYSGCAVLPSFLWIASMPSSAIATY